MLITDPPAKVTDALWMLGTGPYPLFLYQGREQATIFEGGTGAMGPVLNDQIEELGIAADSVKRVVVTHAHPDHVMAVPGLREMFPGVRVAACKVAAKTLGFEKAISFFRQVDDALTESLVKEELIRDEHRPEPMAESQIPVDELIAEGDTVGVDEGVSFQVLQTPGHSDCSLSFYEPGEKILLVSDATGYYMPEYDCWWPNYFVDYGVYMESMRRLAEVEAEVLCLAHNAVVKGAGDVASYLDQAIAATEEYHQRILTDREAGASVREIAERLGAEVYEKTPLLPLDFFQKNCGLLVKQSLKHAGVEGK